MKLTEIGIKSTNGESKETHIGFPLKVKIKESKAILKSEKKSWDGNLVLTKDIKELTYPFDALNPVQSEFYVNRFLDANFIIAAATSAGKTAIAELAKNGKLLYLSPLKAISQEKMDDWTDPSHAWSALNVSISTGDYMLTPDRVDEMRQADVIVMTSEMLDSRSRNMQSERNDWLKDIDTLVIDEFHLIGYDGRGDKLESALIRFTEQNSKCRLICLSATMPNLDELANWLTKLNSKETVIVKSDYRPVILHKHYPTYYQSSNYSENEVIKAVAAMRIVEQNSEDKFIVFVHTKNTGHKVLQTLTERNIRAEFHNADLGKAERIKLQKEFNSKDKHSLRVLVATSTLAWGVNTPADSVIITGLHRGITLVSNQDIHQMCGRAGRIGKTAKGVGNAHILIPNREAETYRQWCEKIDNIVSRMNLHTPKGLETLCFHIIAEILVNRIYDSETLLDWYNRSLAFFQGVSLSLEDADTILAKLEEIKMIKKDEVGFYKVTGLGKVSAYLYYSPFDIHCWFRNFLHLFTNNCDLNEITLGWALGKIDSNDMGYIPQPMQDEAKRFERRREGFDLFPTGNTAHVCAAYYHLINGSEPFPNTLLPVKRGVQPDFDRVCQALKMIDSLYMRWKREDVWERLKWQIKYGVKSHLLELIQLPSIGAVRAKNLYEAGIKNKKDFLERPHIARGVIGIALYDKIANSLEI